MRLLRVVVESPGCSVGEARHHSELGYSSFYTTLKELEARKEVYRCEVGRMKCLVPFTGEVYIWGPQFVALKNTHLATLYRIVKDQEVPTTAEVGAHAERAFGWDLDTTSRRLAWLERAGLVAPYYLENVLNRVRFRALSIHPEASRLLEEVVKMTGVIDR